jgi:hypothetical protein
VLLATRLRTLARRVLGRSVETLPTLEELAARPTLEELARRGYPRQ